MKLCKCDKCGKIYDPSTEGETLETLFWDDGTSYDFCDECNKLAQNYVLNDFAKTLIRGMIKAFCDGKMADEAVDEVIREYLEDTNYQYRQIEREELAKAKAESEAEETDINFDDYIKSIPQKSCEEKCDDKVVAVKDFKRCSGCFKKSQCPAAHDHRCNKKYPNDDDIIDLCEEVYENLPKDDSLDQPKPFDQNGKYYTWNEKEIDFLYNNYKDKSVAEMAEALGRSSNSVYAKMTKLGLKSNGKRKAHGRRPFEKWEVDYIKDNHDLMTIDELADAFGRSSTSVRSKLKELGLEAKKGE